MNPFWSARGADVVAKMASGHDFLPLWSPCLLIRNSFGCP
ncbi:hypothetical protein COLO4_28321 [Corchorus olitorius]|uniref:Uncharacterized protein n=1 Tax=Corchorus olitorius TaxID=93759 RepID=A0A1R3HLX9_9ROSI|nr:hypothetical protein COLO4_28321 [Corchorus olitorius]